MTLHLRTTWAARSFAFLLAGILLAGPALGSDWKVDASGNWNDIANWAGGVPNGTNATAYLDYNITAPRTVTLTSTAMVRLLALSDSTNGYTLTGAGLGTDASGGPFTISSSGSSMQGVGHTIGAPVVLNGPAYIYVYSGHLLMSGALSGSGSLQTFAGGRLFLTGSNTYTGGTTIQASGVVEARDGVGLSAASNLKLMMGGGVLQLLGPSTFTRSLGTGGGQFQWTGGALSARGGKVLVNLGGNAAPIVWGTPYFAPSLLYLGKYDAYDYYDYRGQGAWDSEIEFLNPIDLGGTSRLFCVADNPATSGDFATFSGALSNGGIVKSENGVLVLRAPNTYAGTTDIQAGVLRATDGVGLPAASNLYLNGGVWESDGPSTMLRSLGTGSGQMRWQSGTFGAHGGKLTVNFGGAAAPLVWGAGGLPAAPVWGSPTGDSEMEVVNPIDLNAQTATLTVNGNPASADDFVTFSGVLSNGSITKTGSGTVALTGANTYAGTTTIAGGALRVTDGIGLPAASNLCFTGEGVIESQGATTFTRSIGPGAGQMQWSGNGGFSAHGGKMTVVIGGAAAPTPLTYKSGGFLTSGETLRFGSSSADNETEFKNAIDLAGQKMTVGVSDNPATRADFATLSGILSNGFLRKTGPGRLELTGANTYTGATTIDDGTLYAIEGVGLPATSNLAFGWGWRPAPIFESHGLFIRSRGTAAGQVSWSFSNGGFAARGGKLTVAIGGTASPTLLVGTWAVIDGVIDPTEPSFWECRVTFGSPTADSEVELMNSVDLANYDKPIIVNDNPSTGSDFATFSGRLSGNPTGLTKDGLGTLRLTGANNYRGPTKVLAGALQAADGVGLPIVSNLVLAGGVLESRGAATFTRGLATSGNSKVQWTGSGGFSANGGKMTVALGGTASPTPLTWGNGYFVPVGSTLIFGSVTADNETEFKNSINLAGDTRTVTVLDNPFSAGDFATLSGVLSNGGLTKDGDGLLVLKGGHTYTGPTTVAGGTLALAAGAALASTTLDVHAGATLDLRALVGGLVLGEGQSLTGGGTILGDLTIDGTLDPGGSTGLLAVEDLTLAAGGILTLKLGGTVRGSAYDARSSSGDVVLEDGSTLSVALINGFVPAPGDTFDVLDFASLTGTFTTLNLPALDPGLTWDTGRLYADGVLEVVPEPATLALVALGALAVIRRRRRR